MTPSLCGIIVGWSIAVDREFDPRSDQSKDYKIGMCYLFAKQISIMK